MKLLLFAGLFAVAAQAEPVTKIVCDYSFMGTALAKSELNLDADGTPSSSILVSMGPGTPMAKYTLTPDARADDELVHAWISKEIPKGEIEIITWKAPKADGSQGKLINHNAPMGQEMSGPCTITRD
jgi:hypothetical protein